MECGLLCVDSAEAREGIILGFGVDDRGGGGAGDGAQAMPEAMAIPQILLRSPQPSSACSPSSTPFAPRSPRCCPPHHQFTMAIISWIRARLCLVPGWVGSARLEGQQMQQLV